MNPTLFPPNSSLFLGDLSKFCSEADLEKLFGQYGEINQIRIMRNTNTGKALSYGFISFVSNECAAIAMENLNGISLHGRSMRIGWAAHNLKTHKTEEPAIINSVYVRFITPQTSEYVTEEVIHRAFDQFGSVVDVSIKQSAVDQRSGRQSGYGFVHFSADHAGIIAAFDALSKMNNNTFDGVTYSVEPSKNLLRQMNELNLGMGPGQPSGLQLPVSNAQQQGMYGKAAPAPAPRVDAQYRPRPTRDDQLARLYQHQQHQQQQSMAPQYNNHRAPAPAPQSNGHLHAHSLGSNSGSPRYGGPPGQGYGAAPQYERYPAPPSHVRHNSHDHVQNMLPPSLSAGSSGDEYYGRAHSYSMSPDQQQLSSVGQNMSPRLAGHVGPSHSRNSSRDVYEYVNAKPVENEYVSSYVIEKPAFDERYDRETANSFEVPISDDLRPPLLNVASRPAAAYYNNNGGMPLGLENRGAGGNPARSPYSYGPNGSPHAFGEKQRSPSNGTQVAAAGLAASSQYDRPVQGQVQPNNNNQYVDRRSIAPGSVALSGNSHSFYSHLPPSGSNNNSAPAGTTRPPQQRRPSGVTDLEITRSHSMSSSGLPTYGTNATTDSEGGFFRSANSSFTDGQHGEINHHQFAHLNSFGDNSISQRADTWTGISDKQSLLNRAVPERDARENHRLLSASMRQMSMASMTTTGGDDVDDLVDDDFTFTASLNPGTQSSQDSLFAYTDSNVSSFRTAAGNSAYLNSSALALDVPASSSAHEAQFDNFEKPFGARQMTAHGQSQQALRGAVSTGAANSELDGVRALSLQAAHLSLSGLNVHGVADSPLLTPNYSKGSPMSVSAGSSDLHGGNGSGSGGETKRPSPKSRQLAVTHFFKPVGSV